MTDEQHKLDTISSKLDSVLSHLIGVRSDIIAAIISLTDVDINDKTKIMAQYSRFKKIRTTIVKEDNRDR